MQAHLHPLQAIQKCDVADQESKGEVKSKTLPKGKELTSRTTEETEATVKKGGMPIRDSEKENPEQRD
ncbi:hypothetical protein U1Q18_017452 [Sarracenia purpurea var. burkii]